MTYVNECRRGKICLTQIENLGQNSSNIEGSNTSHPDDVKTRSDLVREERELRREIREKLGSPPMSI